MKTNQILDITTARNANIKHSIMMKGVVMWKFCLITAPTAARRWTEVTKTMLMECAEQFGVTLPKSSVYRYIKTIDENLFPVKNIPWNGFYRAGDIK